MEKAVCECRRSFSIIVQGGRCPPWIRFRFRRNRKRYPPLVRTADEAAPPRRGQWSKSPAELDFYGEFYAALCGAPVLPVLPKAKCGRKKRAKRAKGTPSACLFFISNSRSEFIKSRGVYLAFYTYRGRKFPNGNLRTSVFCEVRTQLVGKTKFFDCFSSDNLRPGSGCTA